MSHAPLPLPLPLPLPRPVEVVAEAGGGRRRIAVLIPSAVGLLLALLSCALVGAPPARAQTDLWVEPVDAPVVDGFRPPDHIGAPGNRGWEYLTEPGSVVGAAHDGVVMFAGAIGSSLYVSVLHPDGRRTTYSFLESVTVAEGDLVGTGSMLGTAGERLHFGLRIGGDYLDPGSLFTTPRPSADAASGMGLRLVVRGGEQAGRSAPAWGLGLDVFWRWLQSVAIAVGAP